MMYQEWLKYATDYYAWVEDPDKRAECIRQAFLRDIRNMVPTKYFPQRNMMEDSWRQVMENYIATEPQRKYINELEALTDELVVLKTKQENERILAINAYIAADNAKVSIRLRGNKKA